MKGISNFLTCVINIAKKFKDYKNFTIEKGCGESESFYLKTEKQYEKNSNQNFILNFVNTYQIFQEDINNVGYNKKLIKLGIYPYMFIPQKWNIPKLQNPIKLIDEKIDNNKLHFTKLKGENNEKITNN